MKLTNKEASEWLMAIKRDYIHGGDEDYDERRKLALDMGAEALENQKTGQWIRLIEDYPNCDMKYKGCSVCRFHYPSIATLEFNYCPHCGAKMIEEGEEKNDRN